MLGTLSPTWFSTTPAVFAASPLWANIVWTPNPQTSPATNITAPRMTCSLPKVQSSKFKVQSSYFQLSTLHLLLTQGRAGRLFRSWAHAVVRLHDRLVVAIRVEQLSVGLVYENDLVRPRFHVRLRIVDGDGFLEMPEVDTPPAFDRVERVAVRVRHVRTEPPVIAESDALDDERVAFPASN